MERLRKPLQGITNIIRFNWHFYFLATVLVLAVFILNIFLPAKYNIYIIFLCILIIVPVLISLFVSFIVYDLSDLYTLNWLDKIQLDPNNNIININAGFDETSILLHNKYPTAALKVFDFYNAEKHTEISIKRARKAYPPYKDTKQVTTETLPLQDRSVDNAFIIFAAHEIRDDKERVIFFRELNRILQQHGKIIVVEHVRDLSNFLAYNIGFLHFLSKQTWKKTFNEAGFMISGEQKITTFITIFILEKNGTSS